MKIPALSASHGSDKRVYLARKFIITTAKTNNKVAAFGTDLKRVVIISILFFIFFSLVLIYIAEDLEPELRYLDWVQKGLYHNISFLGYKGTKIC